MKGFQDWVRVTDPEGQWSRSQIESAKVIFAAGYKACEDAYGDKIRINKDDVKVVLDHFNEVTGKRLTHSMANHTWIINRLKEGFTASELMNVTDYVQADWRDKEFNGTPAKRYIRPQTIWQSREKVAKYLDFHREMIENQSEPDNSVNVKENFKPSF